MAKKPDELHSILLSAWMIWAGFLLTLAIYLGICETLGLQSGSDTNSGLPIIWIRTAFYAVAIILFPVITSLKQLIFKSASRQSKPPNEIANHRKSSKSLYLAGLVLALALATSIGTFGFLLFLMGDNYRTLYMFIGISVICMLIHRPKRKELDQFTVL